MDDAYRRFIPAPRFNFFRTPFCDLRGAAARRTCCGVVFEVHSGALAIEELRRLLDESSGGKRR